jgi:hypothetical protein
VIARLVCLLIITSCAGVRDRYVDPADSIPLPAALAPAAPAAPGVPGDTQWPYVYIDGGACETGVMDVVIVMAKPNCDTIATPMCEVPHPQFPRVQHGDCFYQSWSASQYSTLIRCVDPTGVNTPSGWVGPVDMVNAANRSLCLKVLN